MHQPAGMTSKTIVHTFEGTANTICSNPESDLVCVAGRGLFRIYKILDETFDEHVNLKNSAAGLERRLNLNFTASDVNWSPVEDHILASAGTNGTGKLLKKILLCHFDSCYSLMRKYFLVNV